jgi:TonB family protein
MFTRKLFGVLAILAAAAILFAPGASAQTVYEVSQLTEKPRIASPMAAQRAIQRAYPRTLQTRGVGGKVMLQFVLTEAGRVDEASIVVQASDNDELSAAARSAIANIEFVPGMVDGSAVRTRVVFPIVFASG